MGHRYPTVQQLQLLRKVSLRWPKKATTVVTTWKEVFINNLMDTKSISNGARLIYLKWPRQSYLPPFHNYIKQSLCWWTIKKSNAGLPVWQCHPQQISTLKHMAKQSSNIEKDISTIYITKLCSLNKRTIYADSIKAKRQTLQDHPWA